MSDYLRTIYSHKVEETLERTGRFINLPWNQLLLPRLCKHRPRALQSLGPPRKPHEHRINQTELFPSLFQLFRLW